MAYSLSFFFGQCRVCKKFLDVCKYLNLIFYEFNSIKDLDTLYFIRQNEQLKNIDLYLIISNVYTLLKSNYNSLHEGNKHIKIVKDVRLKINDAWFNTNIRFYLQDLLGE